MSLLERYLVVVVTVDLALAAIMYEMDQHCESRGIPMQWMEDKDVVIVHGKTSATKSFRECVVMFGPSSKATKKTTRIEFISYDNSDCGVSLAMQQSPKTMFGKDYSTVFNYTCHTGPVHGVIYHADAGNNIWLILKKANSKIINYNFQINITLTDHKIEVESMSGVLIICIAAVITIAIIGTACIVCWCYRIQKLTKRRLAEEVSVTSHDGRSRMTMMRYTDLPGHEEHVTGSQICILGSVNPDGTCTVCNRHHDDFAHVVDVDHSGRVIETVHSGHHGNARHRQNGVQQDSSSQPCILGSQDADGTCTICNRHHEDFAHVVDVNRDGVIQETIASSRTTRHDTNRNNIDLAYSDDSPSSTPQQNRVRIANGHRNNRAGPGSRLSHNSDEDDDDNDDDVDLSGNDLIPPSYDLSPPPYDEAVNMPKPDTGTTALDSGEQLQEVAESDPLYQNINSFSRERI